MTAPDPKTVREIARTAVSYVIRDNLVQAAMAEHGISADNVYAWSEIYDVVLDTIAAGVQQPAEATGGEQLPWPRTQRMPLAVVGSRPQPWHHQAIAEYDEVRGETTQANTSIYGGYTARQVNQAIAWWNERAELEQQLDKQNLAWHELRLFSGPDPRGEGDLEQHELTHPTQCQTLPPGAVCWAERQPFRWWWPTAHGTYRIRPEDLLPLGGDGPDYQMTLHVQVRREDEWFEYTNDVIGPDPTDEAPAIAERLKAMVAEKAKQLQSGAAGGSQVRDGAVEEVRAFLAALPPRIDIVADWTRGGVRNVLTAEALRAVLALLDDRGVMDLAERNEQLRDERDALAARVAELTAERDALVVLGEADTRAVARCQRAKAGPDAVPAMLALDARFADRIAALGDEPKVPEKRTPEEWCTRYGVDIADPDGWRHRDAPAWDEPITLADFLNRARQSTARNVPSVDWKRIARDADVAGGKQ